MRKKLIYLLSLSITFILLFFLILLNYTYSPFDSKNVKDNIELLSSDTYNGRLAGSVENSMVANFIESEFKSNKLKPYKDSYIDEFTTVCPISTNTSLYLNILSNGEVEEEFDLEVDEKEILKLVSIADLLDYISNFTEENVLV